MAVRDTILPEKITEMKKWVRETLWSHKKKEPPEWRLGLGRRVGALLGFARADGEDVERRAGAVEVA